ncbi:rhodanese-like domain-containing protein [Bdellovibrio sp. BCCA]|uniref:rhodanese-like domain-containing protein n=1 Tax=Bdellovibrio sp. BCCA TaxID=3136281 RepID=UPI0030EFFE14
MKNNLFGLILICLGLSTFAYGKTVYLDVRTQKEYEQEHIPQAINIDVLKSSFKSEVAKLNHDDDYKVYCRSGKRSAQAISIMKDSGFKHLENLGGLEDAKKYLNKASLGK